MLLSAFRPARRLRCAFSIIEIAVILVIIALMVVIVAPHFLISHRKAQADRVKRDLEALNSAVEHYALDNGKVAGDHPAYADLRKYLDSNTDVYRRNGKDVLGDTYGPFTVGTRPSVPKKTEDTLSAVADQDFWSPYR